MDENEIINQNVNIIENQNNIDVIETIDVIDVTDAASITIDSLDAFPALGESNEYLKHQLLNGRELPDQHPITAITGLREELNNIEALGVVYSDERNQANYYLWEDENLLQENRVGYFVNIRSDINEIGICTSNNDIFGVTVDGAGFIGAQSDVARDYKYGLVAHTGIVHVRCELSVNVGDYVVSNDYGYAQKNKSGYRVVGRHQIDGIEYAEITLVPPMDSICELTDDVDVIKSRVDDAEINIAAAMNVANEAYNRASETSNISEEAIKNALDAVGKVDGAIEEVGKIEDFVSSINATAVQAKAIAESAATSAKSMCDEAIKVANDAVADTSELRKELENTVADMDTKLENAASELKTVKENLETTKNGLQKSIDDAVLDVEELAKDMEPLVTWPNAENPTGTAGFVARANEDSAILASVTKFEGEFGESITGFVQEATKENATVKAIASYQQKDADGNVISDGAAGLISQVDANTASINLLTELEGEGFSGLAGLVAKVDANSSSVSTLASHVVGEFENTDDWVADGKDTSIVYYAKNNGMYYYYDQGWRSTEKAYEAGLTGSLAIVQGVADDNKSQLDAMVSYDKNGKSALAGLTAYVDEESANFIELAQYNNKNSGNSGISGLVADVDDNTSTLSAVVNHEFTKNDGTVVTGLAGLNEYVNENESNVSLVANRVAGKYTVIDSWNASGKNTNTVYYAKDAKLYWYYNNGWKNTADAYVAGLPASTAGIQVVADEHSSKINSLAAFDTNTEINLARIEQKADANGAYIHSTVANIDKYSVGPYSQAYGFTLEQAKEVLEKGIVYVPTVSHSGESFNTNYSFTKANTYTWSGTTWIETIGQVVFSGTMPSGSSYPLWYTDNETVTAGYEPYTLYKYGTYATVDDDGNATTKIQWAPVATLRGNSSNRAVSQIRQDANSIELSVTALDDKYAGTKIWVDDNKSAIQDTVKWKNDNAESVATFMQEAGDNFASASQVAKVVDKDGNVNAASIVTAINDGDSSVVIDADHIDISGIDISLAGETINLTADDIKIESTNFSVDKDGKIKSKAGSIGGINIVDGSIWSSSDGNVNFDPNKTINLPNPEFFRGDINIVNGKARITGWETTSAWRNYIYPIEKGAKVSVKKSSFFEVFVFKNQPDDNGDYDIEFHGTSSSECRFDVPENQETYYVVINMQYDTGYTITATRTVNSTAFSLTNDGYLTCTGANIMGHIEAESGSFKGRVEANSGIIGGWGIGKDKYHQEDGLYYEYIADEVEKYTLLTGNGIKLHWQPADLNYNVSWFEVCQAAMNSSDARIKNTIKDLNDNAENFFDSLRPCSFYYNKQASMGSSSKKHFGFVAQDVIESMNNTDLLDFAGIWNSDITDFYSLDKQEFIALNTWQIQKLKSRVAELENIVAKLQEKEE